MNRQEPAVFTNMCMICDGAGNVLVQNRLDPDWPGITFPGGHVERGESFTDAVIREVSEELNITGKIIRPLWLNQGFFIEDVDGLQYHEICIYFLVDVSDTGLLSKGDKFFLQEGKHQHTFEWLKFEQLQHEYFYPVFIKKEIFHLPSTFVIRTEYE